LREFTRNVIVNEFGGPEPTEFMLDALVAYMLEFDFQPNSYLSPDGTLNEDASEAARRGEVIFNTPYESMGGRACSTCHVPSSNFIDGLTHDIGSGDPSAPFARDAFFDTPTLVNSNYTAPYFHDGSLEALADVVEWFDQQYQLGLSSEEETDLTAYLVEVGSADEPFEVFDEENTPFALDWAELTTFSSTLGSMLIPRQDAYHAILLIDSVAPDMRVDASGLQDLSQAPLVYEIADKLDEIKAAIEAHDWERAAALYEEYESLVAEYTPILK
jgi:mono/diheme cytochrome c family protein